METPLACVLRRPAEPPSAWEQRLDSGVQVLDPSSAGGIAEVVPNSSCVLVDGVRSDAVPRVSSARRVDSAVQGVIVAPATEQPRLRREILFTPGLGEVWVVAPEEVGRSLIARAAEVTWRRRRHRQTRSQVEHALAAIEPRAAHRTVVSDAYLASLLDAAPEPILSVDQDGIVLSWNPGAERTLGFTRREAVGKPLTEILGTDASRIRLPDDGDVVRVEISFRRKTGDQGVAECTVAPVDAGERRVYAVLLHDLTEERRSQELLEAQASELEAQAAEMESQSTALEEYTIELERMNAELQKRSEDIERVSSARSRFYASMSHELRTPINAIIGFNSLVLDGVYGEVPERQRYAIERSQRAAGHLLELINDVLDLSKIEAGRLELQLEATCVPVLIHELLDTVHSLAEQHGSTIDVQGEATGHCISSDPRRVRQILLNLLSNAIKFGESNPITVRWGRTEGGGLSVEVIDRGKGISPENIERIFEEFSQIDPAAAGGTGLGLAISRALTKLLGGTLTVDSKESVGSRFTLTLPPAAPALARGS